MRFVCTFHYLHFDEFWEHDIIIWLFISDDVFLLKASREFIRDDLMSFIQGNNKDGRDILIRFPPLLSLKMIMSVIEMVIRRGRSKCWSMMVTGKPMEKTWMSANNKNLKSSEKQSKLRRIKTMMINIIAIIVVTIIIIVSVHQGALLDAGQLHHIHTIRRWSDKIITIIIIIIVPLLFPRGDHCDCDHDGGGVEHEAGQILWIARKFKNNCWRQLQGKIDVTKCRLCNDYKDISKDDCSY